MARQPCQPAVWVDPQLLGLHALEESPDPPRDEIGALDVEVLEVEHAGAELFRAIELAPELRLGHLAVGELEDELVGAHRADRREQRPVRPLAVAESLQRAEADVPEPALDRDAIEAPIVELDEPLGLHEKALVDVVELEVA